MLPESFRELICRCKNPALVACIENPQGGAADRLAAHWPEFQARFIQPVGPVLSPVAATLSQNALRVDSTSEQSRLGFEEILEC